MTCHQYAKELRKYIHMNNQSTEKKRVLIIINTYFQLMTAIQIVLKNYYNYESDFIITDNLSDYEDIALRMKNFEFVHGVFTARSRKIAIPRDNKSRIESIKDCIWIKNYIKSKTNIDMDSRNYDVLLFHNIDIFTYIVYAFVQKWNKGIILRRFEEGFSIYLSYNDRPHSEKIGESISKILGRRSLINNIQFVYLYHPEYLTYNMPCGTKKIPLISKNDERYRKIVNSIFNYNAKEARTKKLIIFEESFYADKTPIEDYPLFCEIINKVTPDMVSLKLHPRNTINRFSKTKAHIFDGGHAPWEVLQLNNSYESNVFATITSGSVLASILYFDEKIPTIFLYKVVDGDFKLKTNYEKYLNKVRSSQKDSLIYIPENKEQLFRILEDLV